MNEDIISYQERIIKELIEEKEVYKRKIINAIARDIKLIDGYNMNDFKLGLQHAITLINLEDKK